MRNMKSMTPFAGDMRFILWPAPARTHPARPPPPGERGRDTIASHHLPRLPRTLASNTYTYTADNYHGNGYLELDILPGKKFARYLEPSNPD